MGNSTSRRSVAEDEVKVAPVSKDTTKAASGNRFIADDDTDDDDDDSEEEYFDADDNPQPTQIQQVTVLSDQLMLEIPSVYSHIVGIITS